jgi:hypothetical protein
MRPITRITPNGKPGDYQTYSITSPPDRAVKAACEQVGCEQWRLGWHSVLDETTPLGKSQAAYIRQRSGRTFREQRTGAGLTVFLFDSGQRCFADHKTRPELYAVQRGDWRAHSGPVRRHQRAADWQEDFGEHQLRLAEQQQRG